MNPRGRPTLYHPDLCPPARELCRLGASNDQLATAFGVAPRSVDNWIARIPEFAAAVNEGRATVRGEMARSLYRRAIGYKQTVERVVRLRGGATRTVTYTRHHLPETRACIRYLYLRRPQDWRRRPDLPADARQNRMPPAAQEFGDWQPTQNDDAKVTWALHQRTVGCEQTVERVVTWWGEPQVITCVRQHRPQYQAGVVWLTNRLPEQWKPLAALRTPASAEPASPAAHNSATEHPEVGAVPCAAAGALNKSDLAKRQLPPGSPAVSSRAGLPEAPTVGGSGDIRAQEISKGLPAIPEMPIFRPWSPGSRGPPASAAVNRYSLRHKPAEFVGVLRDL